jgi:nicotinate-nucleotide pyrophosphorylase (carboxylating)
MGFSFDVPDITSLIHAAVAEDVGSGDVTTQTCVPKNATMTGSLVARTPLLVAGLPFLALILTHVGANVTVALKIQEGSFVPAGTVLATFSGSARDLLTYERVMLNMLYVSCGIATTTKRYTEHLEGTQTQLLDTRKTWPGLRAVSKYASRIGGAVNHRMGLYDAVMIKDNHRSYIKTLPETVKEIRANHPGLPVIYECDTMGDVKDGLNAGVDHLLLDNMSPEAVAHAVLFIDKKAITEASGGITLETIRAYAQTGVDYISTSAITMNPEAVDLGLDKTFDLMTINP